MRTDNPTTLTLQRPSVDEKVSDAAETILSTHGQGDSSEVAGHFRILLIDDTVAIHCDFRKILAEDDAAALDRSESELFGVQNPPRPRGNFAIDSAYQGQEGLTLLKRAIVERNPY